MTKLVTAWDTWCRHLRDQAKGMGHRLDDKALRPIASQLLYGGSGLLPPWPDTFDDAARRILDRRADDLETAMLYVLSPSMCDVAIAAAQTLTIDDLALIDEADLPSPTGGRGLLRRRRVRAAEPLTGARATNVS